jgi:CubicO group peptidase (beta-lactamase class C family)
MKALYFSLAFLLFASCADAQSPRSQDLDTYMNAEESVKEFSGTVLIIQKGKKVYEKSTLFADREWKIPNSTQAKYRIGSITKQFTAVLILKLEEEGKLSVNDKLSKYYPGYPKGDSVTLHMLLNHTSGIKNYTAIPGIWQSLNYKYSVDSLIRVFKNRPYDFAPGSKWSYSNSGYYLLGMIIEKVSGKKYVDFLREQIIAKVPLKNTDLEDIDSIYAFRAKGYTKRGNNWRNADYMEMEGAWSAGAMISTAEDLNSWIKALYSNKIINVAETNKMFTPDSITRGYGFGIISDSLNKHRRIWHNGGINGFSSHLAYFPDEDITVVVLCNNDADNADRVANSVSKIMYNVKVNTPYIPKEVKVDPSILASYTGKYKTPSDQIELVLVNNKLYRRRPGAPDLELKPESATRFFYADNSDRFIEFVEEGGQKKGYLIAATEKYPLEMMNN